MPSHTPTATPTPTQTPTPSPTPAAASCNTDTTLCLTEGRFLIRATWTKPDGESGAAHAISLTEASGYFWFFDPTNVEVAIKALDGCSVNDHIWIFSAGMTNLAVSMTVTDTLTNQSKTYSNAQGAPFQTVTDTTSFGTCPTPMNLMSSRTPEEPREPGSGTMAARTKAAALPASAPGCVGSDTVMCLNGRFQVQAFWQTVSGSTGSGHAANLTPESGYFWFFDPANVELFVKALDGCAIGSDEWFFAAGMTNLGVQLNVTDTFTGEVKVYGNAPVGAAPGTPFIPILDTAAFSSCRPGPPQTYTVSLVFIGSRRGCSSGTFAFQPSEIHIHAGDTITWSLQDGIHEISGQSPNGQWSSGVLSGSSSHSLTFTQAGTFSYLCALGHEHSVLEFQGGSTRCCYWTCSPITHYQESGTIIVDP